MSIGTPARTDDARVPPDGDVAGPRRDLNLPDFRLLVVGASIGADIYIVASPAGADLGPAQLVAWLVAGLLGALSGALPAAQALDREVARWCVRGEHWLLRSPRRQAAPHGWRE